MATYTPLSGLCLLGACISAIAAVGSIFELSSGSPEWGNSITTGILVISIPLCIGLFYIAVQSSNAANQK
jgi:hypothetical protein